MFKYIWIVLLAIAYAVAWFICVAQIIEWVDDMRKCELKFDIEYLDEFAQGWILTHIVVLALASFFAWAMSRI